MPRLLGELPSPVDQTIPDLPEILAQVRELTKAHGAKFKLAVDGCLPSEAQRLAQGNRWAPSGSPLYPATPAFVP